MPITRSKQASPKLSGRSLKSLILYLLLKVARVRGLECLLKHVEPSYIQTSVGAVLVNGRKMCHPPKRRALRISEKRDHKSQSTLLCNEHMSENIPDRKHFLSAPTHNFDPFPHRGDAWVHVPLFWNVRENCFPYSNVFWPGGAVILLSIFQLLELISFQRYPCLLQREHHTSLSDAVIQNVWVSFLVSQVLFQQF